MLSLLSANSFVQGVFENGQDAEGQGSPKSNTRKDCSHCHNACKTCPVVRKSCKTCAIRLKSVSCTTCRLILIEEAGERSVSVPNNESRENNDESKASVVSRETESYDKDSQPKIRKKPTQKHPNTAHPSHINQEIHTRRKKTTKERRKEAPKKNELATSEYEAGNSDEDCEEVIVKAKKKANISSNKPKKKVETIRRIERKSLSNKLKKEAAEVKPKSESNKQRKVELEIIQKVEPTSEFNKQRKEEFEFIRKDGSNKQRKDGVEIIREYIMKSTPNKMKKPQSGTIRIEKTHKPKKTTSIVTNSGSNKVQKDDTEVEKSNKAKKVELIRSAEDAKPKSLLDKTKLAKNKKLKAPSSKKEHKAGGKYKKTNKPKPS